MADGFWTDKMAWIEELALNAWVNINPSPQWASRQIEPYLGLPFGPYLRSARPRRQRTLTGPLDPSQDTLWHRMQVLTSLQPEQRSDEQTGSAFLSKLPYDVRVMVYEMVLGGQVFHLSAQNAKSRITYYVCNRPDSIESDGALHNCLNDLHGRPSAGLRPQLDKGILSLLLTCRRVYSEVAPVLYSTNTFVFTQNFAAFTFLKLMLPTQRLSCFRHFRLHMRIPRHPNLNHRAVRDWRDLWTFFDAEMTGLKRLYVELQMLQPTEALIESTPDDKAEAWVKPIVTMALNAHWRRGCVVELETRHVRHYPVQTYSTTAQEHNDAKGDQLVSWTCAALHRSIRLSLV